MSRPRPFGAPQKKGEDQLVVVQTATTPLDVVAEIVMTSAPGQEEEEIPPPRNREERRALASFLRKQKKFR